MATGALPPDPRNLFEKRLIKNFYKFLLVVSIKRERFRPEPKISLPGFVRVWTDGRIAPASVVPSAPQRKLKDE